MRSSYVIGCLFGILLTAALWFTANKYKLLSPPKSVEQKAAELSDSPDLPISDVDDGFEPAKATEDLMARRAQLSPSMTVDLWDRTVELGSKEKPLKRTSPCDFTDPSAAISVSAEQAELLLARKMNILFLDRTIPICYEQAGKAAIVVDDLTSQSKLINVVGEIVVDRILERDVALIADTFLSALKISKDDLPYLMNPEIAPNRRFVSAAVLHVTVTNQQPLLDAVEVPEYFAGVQVLKAAALAAYFANFHTEKKPVFIDARENHVTGAPYPGAVSAAFHSTLPVQLKFQPDLTVSNAKGASFDLKAIPADRLTPLIVYGADVTDAAPLWLMRHLRILGHRNIFFVHGGLKELNEVKPPIQF